MPTENGITVTDLGTEVWYQVEMSPKGDNDWVTTDSRTFDSMIAAKSALDRRIANYGDDDEYDFRLVRVTTKTEVVAYE